MAENNPKTRLKVGQQDILKGAFKNVRKHVPKGSRNLFGSRSENLLVWKTCVVLALHVSSPWPRTREREGKMRISLLNLQTRLVALF